MVMVVLVVLGWPWLRPVHGTLLAGARTRGLSLSGLALCVTIQPASRSTLQSGERRAEADARRAAGLVRLPIFQLLFFLAPMLLLSTVLAAMRQ
ncbi:hypothetical protein EGJ29_06190 [Pseudomonas sp. s199]|nr:hypothetical protein EGJ29_06190 [Pseudomonas sp. s199]